MKESYFAQGKRERLAWIAAYLSQILSETDTHSLNYGKLLDICITRFGLSEKLAKEDIDLAMRVNNYVLDTGEIKRGE